MCKVLSEKLVVRILNQLLVALDHVHACGVDHQDWVRIVCVSVNTHPDILHLHCRELGDMVAPADVQAKADQFRQKPRQRVTADALAAAVSEVRGRKNESHQQQDRPAQQHRNSNAEHRDECSIVNERCGRSIVATEKLWKDFVETTHNFHCLLDENHRTAHRTQPCPSFVFHFVRVGSVASTSICHYVANGPVARLAREECHRREECWAGHTEVVGAQCFTLNSEALPLVGSSSAIDFKLR